MPLSFFLLIKNNLGLGSISLVAFLHGCCSAISRGSTPCMCTLLLSPCDLLISRFCSPVWLVFGTLTETYFEKAVNNGSFSKHKVSWQSILKGPWKYWAKTLQCLFIVQLMSSVAQQQRIRDILHICFPMQGLFRIFPWATGGVWHLAGNKFIAVCFNHPHIRSSNPNGWRFVLFPQSSSALW